MDGCCAEREKAAHYESRDLGMPVPFGSEDFWKRMAISDADRWRIRAR